RPVLPNCSSKEIQRREIFWRRNRNTITVEFHLHPKRTGRRGRCSHPGPEVPQNSLDDIVRHRFHAISIHYWIDDQYRSAGVDRASAKHSECMCNFASRIASHRFDRLLTVQNSPPMPTCKATTPPFTRHAIKSRTQVGSHESANRVAPACGLTVNNNRCAMTHFIQGAFPEAVGSATLVCVSGGTNIPQEVDEIRRLPSVARRICIGWTGQSFSTEIAQFEYANMWFRERDIQFITCCISTRVWAFNQHHIPQSIVLCTGECPDTKSDGNPLVTHGSIK